jgi:hypothetical protein
MKRFKHLVFLALLATFAIGCGGPILEPGSYAVSMSITRNTCPVDISGTTTGTYDVSVSDDEEYRVVQTANGSSTASIMTGRESGGTVVLSSTESESFDGCTFNFNYAETLTPTKNGFKGSGKGDVRACDGSSCEYAYSLTGKGP